MTVILHKEFVCLSVCLSVRPCVCLHDLAQTQAVVFQAVCVSEDSRDGVHSVFDIMSAAVLWAHTYSCCTRCADQHSAHTVAGLHAIPTLTRLSVCSPTATEVCASAGKLLASFGSGWSISIDRVPPSADMAASPLQPFLVTVTRCPQQPQHTQETDGQVNDLDDIDIEDGSDLRAGQNGACPKPAPAVQLSFGAEAGAVNGEQLADIVKVVLR